MSEHVPDDDEEIFIPTTARAVRTVEDHLAAIRSILNDLTKEVGQLSATASLQQRSIQDLASDVKLGTTQRFEMKTEIALQRKETQQSLGFVTEAIAKIGEQVDKIERAQETAQGEVEPAIKMANKFRGFFQRLRNLIAWLSVTFGAAAIGDAATGKLGIIDLIRKAFFR